MARLAQAPLLEAIFELRWGLVKKETNEIKLAFSPEESKFFPGQFRSLATSKGYSHMEAVNQPPFPHMINYRFRKAPNTWPCIQMGTGIITTNQVNDGYEWKTFKADVISTVEIFDKAHPNHLKGINPLYIELRYHDGFTLGDNETPSQFLNDKLNFGFNPPDNFLNSPFLTGQVTGHSVSFQIETMKPKGVLIFAIDEADINGKKGFIMQTVMRSEPAKLSKKWLLEWLEEAHTTQKHAFSTLIKPELMEAFE